MFMHSWLTLNMDELKTLCELHHVKSLFAFGSVITKDFTPNSDIDLLVDIENTDPVSYSDDYFSLKFKLQKLFKRKIDLLEHKAIHNKYLKAHIDSNKILLYGKGY